MASLSVSSRGSVDWMPAECLGGHGFNSRQELRFFLCPMLVSCWLFHHYHFITKLKIHHHLHVQCILLSFTMTTSTLLFLAVWRMCVIHVHELSLMALLSMSCTGPVDRAPARYLEGHGFDPVVDSDFFFAPRSCHVDYFMFIPLSLSSKFTIIYFITNEKFTFDFPRPGTPRTRLLQTIPHPQTPRARLVPGVAVGVCLQVELHHTIHQPFFTCLQCPRELVALLLHASHLNF